MKIILKAGIVVAAVLLPASAHAAESGFGVSLSIPTVCGLDASSFVVSDGGTITGYVKEYCNSSRMFQVVASHRPLDDGEKVILDYGADRSQLDPAGYSQIAYRRGPRMATVPVSISAIGLQDLVAVSFAITAI